MYSDRCFHVLKVQGKVAFQTESLYRDGRGLLEDAGYYVYDIENDYSGEAHIRKCVNLYYDGSLIMLEPIEFPERVDPISYKDMYLEYDSNVEMFDEYYTKLIDADGHVGDFVLLNMGGKAVLYTSPQLSDNIKSELTKGGWVVYDVVSETETSSGQNSNTGTIVSKDHVYKTGDLCRIVEWEEPPAKKIDITNPHLVPRFRGFKVLLIEDVCKEHDMHWKYPDLRLWDRKMIVDSLKNAEYSSHVTFDITMFCTLGSVKFLCELAKNLGGKIFTEVYHYPIPIDNNSMLVCASADGTVFPWFTEFNIVVDSEFHRGEKAAELLKLIDNEEFNEKFLKDEYLTFGEYKEFEDIILRYLKGFLVIQGVNKTTSETLDVVDLNNKEDKE